MRPPAAEAVIACTAARQHSMQLKKFISICWRIVATAASRNGAAAKPPAMWIEAHSGAMPSISAGHGRLVGEVAGHGQRHLLVIAQAKAFRLRLVVTGHVT